MIKDYGGKPLDNFPIPETPKWPEFLISASINGESKSYTELKVYVLNHSAWPARVIKDLSFNYYFDITEIIEGGLTVKDITTRLGSEQHSGDEGKASITEPLQYKDNIYYVKISFGDGRVIMPSGQSDHRAEVQFRISIPDYVKIEWDPSNDYSYKNLNRTMASTPYITLYDGDKLIWGTEPDGTTVESS